MFISLPKVVIVSVCHGDQLNLSCHTTPNVTLLQWTLSIPDRPGPDIRFLSSSGSTQNVLPLIVGQTVFQFLRISVSPLKSTLVINNVSTSLNGTRVECSYNSEVMETTTISVIGNGMLNWCISDRPEHNDFVTIQALLLLVKSLK